MNPARRRNCPLNEQAVGWALHALEPDEEMEVLLHLPRCPSCQVAVLEAERILAALGASVEQVEPPATLRDALLAGAAETPQHSPMLRPRTSPETDLQSLPEGPGTTRRHRRTLDGDTPPPRVTAPGNRPSWFSRRGRRLVAASLALVGVLTAGGLTVRATELAETAQTQAQTLAEIVTQLDEPGTTRATLAAADGAALAAVVVHDGRRTLVTAGLAPNAGERDTYVVWGTGNGAPRPIATFDVGGQGTDVRNVGSASTADGFSGYAISLEPGRTAPASPTTVVASGQVET
ncbi:MAG: anti-sigma factor domain-containing protein [Pseudonocardia sp.]